MTSHMALRRGFTALSVLAAVFAMLISAPPASAGHCYHLVEVPLVKWRELNEKWKEALASDDAARICAIGPKSTVAASTLINAVRSAPKGCNHYATTPIEKNYARDLAAVQAKMRDTCIRGKPKKTPA